MGKQGSCNAKGRVKIEIGEEVSYFPRTSEIFQLSHGKCKKVSLPLHWTPDQKICSNKKTRLCVCVNIAALLLLKCSLGDVALFTKFMVLLNTTALWEKG